MYLYSLETRSDITALRCLSSYNDANALSLVSLSRSADDAYDKVTLTAPSYSLYVFLYGSPDMRHAR